MNRDEHTPTPVEVPLPVPVNYTSHRPTGEHAVPINRIQLPLLMALGAGIVMASAITSFVLVWGKVMEHTESKIVHVDSQDVIKGGGVAYKTDLAAEGRKTRKMLKDMIISCKKGGEGFICKTELPEPFE